MADTLNNKPKMPIRAGLPTLNGDKSPLPSTKLLINHGKPNFTIQRSPKADENSNGNPLSPQALNNNNYTPFKTANGKSNNNNSNSNSNNNNIIVGTKFNGVFKPSTLTIKTQPTDAENEAAKVVLRRAKVVQEPSLKDGEDENVPEFIRRQRRIQERLAKENILDFENRRSGYFTHVMISPDSPNRTSFVETMSSPAIVPSLEIPPPQQTITEESSSEVEAHATTAVATALVDTLAEEPKQSNEAPIAATEQTLSNGHTVHDDVEPDVAQAIEEVNKAVAGEDDEKESEVAIAPVKAVEEVSVEEPKTEVAAAVVAPVVTSAPIESSAVETPKQNGHAVDETQQNGHANHESDNTGVTISHTNGVSNGPSIPTPDPSGALGVNYEPKTVVSFAQELSNGENKYPDMVKVTTDDATAELQELSKLKFEIKTDDKDVQVTPVLRAE